MTEAVGGLLDWVRQATVWRGVEAVIFLGNIASERILLRHGFQPVGESTAANAFHGRELPIRDYRLTRD